jgi:antitoxin (DNA-binding transcriptional repressor) of toxin-antitoxin stability system
MRAVGVRELKNRLSEYLRLVREGQDILVTDRGEVIAELRRPGRPADVAHPALIEALRSGRARLGSANRPDIYTPLDPVFPAGAAKRLLDDDRDNR